MSSHACPTNPRNALIDGLGVRIPLSHATIDLDDGHRVGVSIGGRGVPLVFMHGLALNRRAYEHMLSHLAGLGFLVVAIDTPGHGDTHALPRGAGDLANHAELILRTLDVLGIRKAVFAGHSMGGRMAIHLAAKVPDRALAVVLLNAAAGACFDATMARVMNSPAGAIGTLVRMGIGVPQDPLRLSVVQTGQYVKMLAGVAISNVRRLRGPARAALALARSGDYTPLLRRMRDYGVPTLVLHGEKDQSVPFDAACDIAHAAGGSLYRVRQAFHSWMIANPRQGVGAWRQLLQGELGAVLSKAAHTLGIADWRDFTAWHEALFRPSATIRAVVGEPRQPLAADDYEPVDMSLERRVQDLRPMAQVA